MAGESKPRREKPPSVFCPVCNVQDARQPVLAPMGVRFIQNGGGQGEEAYDAPHFAYRCTRCGYGEVHDRILAA